MNKNKNKNENKTLEQNFDNDKNVPLQKHTKDILHKKKNQNQEANTIDDQKDITAVTVANVSNSDDSFQKHKAQCALANTSNVPSNSSSKDESVPKETASSHDVDPNADESSDNKNHNNTGTEVILLNPTSKEITSTNHNDNNIHIENNDTSNKVTNVPCPPTAAALSVLEPFQISAEATAAAAAAAASLNLHNHVSLVNLHNHSSFIPILPYPTQITLSNPTTNPTTDAQKKVIVKTETYDPNVSSHQPRIIPAYSSSSIKQIQDATFSNTTNYKNNNLVRINQPKYQCMMDKPDNSNIPILPKSTANNNAAKIQIEEQLSSFDNDTNKSTNPSSATQNNKHQQLLASRREKDRERYKKMTTEEKDKYNLKRREQYYTQTEESRRRRRERERFRYHALDTDSAKDRNKKRAALERERYKKLTPEQLAARNAKRRKRAALRRKDRLLSPFIEISDGPVVGNTNNMSTDNEKIFGDVADLSGGSTNNVHNGQIVDTIAVETLIQNHKTRAKLKKEDRKHTSKTKTNKPNITLQSSKSVNVEDEKEDKAVHSPSVSTVPVITSTKLISINKGQKIRDDPFIPSNSTIASKNINDEIYTTGNNQTPKAPPIDVTSHVLARKSSKDNKDLHDMEVTVEQV